MLEEPKLTHGIRAALAVALTISLPFVLYRGSGSPELMQAYQDAVAAVVAFYFGVSGTSAVD